MFDVFKIARLPKPDWTEGSLDIVLTNHPEASGSKDTYASSIIPCQLSAT